MSSSQPRFVQAVDVRLRELLADRRSELLQAAPGAETVAEVLDEFLTGGKRLRPLFCWWGWLAGGGRDTVDDCAPVVSVGAALELLQACALIHDDLIDRSDTRRGRPAVHHAAAKEHASSGWTGDADHFGSGIAVLYGDFALAWADDLFVESAAVLQALPRSQPAWRTMRTQVLTGQWLDLMVSQIPVAATSPEESLVTARRVVHLKTAGYTVTGPLLLGASLAGAAPAVLCALTEYGDAVGAAFQLRDDLLGVLGEPEQTGKPSGDDLREGKRTELIATARADLLRAGRTETLEALESGLGAVTLPSEVDELRAVIGSTDAETTVEQRISELLETAARVLDEVELPGTVRDGLDAMARRAAHRTR